MKITYKELIERIEQMDDDSIDQLEKAMHYYCSSFDIAEGYKHALILELNDQYGNHADEQPADDLDKIIEILKLNG